MPSTTPKPTAIREPPALTRFPVSFLTPSQLNASTWRSLVAGAPIVRACVQTLVMQISGLEWSLEGEDDKAKEYFTTVLENADADDGGGWEVYLSRIIKDTLEVPFGGAAEIGTYPDGVVAWSSHVDGATLVPTFNQRTPYAQISPFGMQIGPPVTFKPGQIGRVRWQAQSDLRAYGWTITPVMDCLPAIQALLRADRFWQSFLIDGPPPGILDIPGWDEQEAQSWYDSWKKMLSGISPLKVPILAGANRENKQAQFIEFAKSPAETQMLDLIKSYAEAVTACFGMSLGDLGLFGQELRLAGATKLIELTQRQGMAKLMRGVKTMIDLDILPDGLEFKWSELDLQDELRKEQAKEIGSRRLKNLVDSGMLSSDNGRLVALAEGIIPPDVIDEALELVAEEPTPAPKITAETLGSESEPTSESIAAEMGQRARDNIQAFPLTSKWANKMARLADKLMEPARRGLTQARAIKLIELGIKAYGGLTRSVWESGPSPTSGERVTRAIADSRDALEKALSKADWWKSPNLVDEVSAVLRGAYEEGATVSIKVIDEARVELGFESVKLGTTTFNLTNKSVLSLVRTRAGEFIRHIDDGTLNAIVNAILRGVRDGLSSPQIAKSILASSSRQSLVETFKGRALSIVNTEINWAESEAALQQQKKLGLTKKRWISIPAIRCPMCEANSADGLVDNKHRFRSVFGSCSAPPAHPGVCHCRITFSKTELKTLGESPSYWLGS